MTATRRTELGGLLQPDPETGLCPFKRSDGLCGLHGTPEKFLGCVVSPFTLNAAGTVIIRNRYTKMACHGAGEPAYRVFRPSLVAMFGEHETARITALLDDGADGMIDAAMSVETLDALRYLDGLKHGAAFSHSPSGQAGQPGPHARAGRVGWAVADARKLAEHATGLYDLIFTCPPYFDLERYSDDAADLSNATSYDAFLCDMAGIIKAAASRLRPGRFAVFVVGDIRDKLGLYRNLSGEIIRLCAAGGLALYNDAILVTAVGSLPVRVSRAFNGGRKLGKTHQNVLVFYNGDPRRIAEDFGPVVAPADWVGKGAEE